MFVLQDITETRMRYTGVSKFIEYTERTQVHSIKLQIALFRTTLVNINERKKMLQLPKGEIPLLKERKEKKMQTARARR